MLNSSVHEYLAQLEKKIPEFASSGDLVKLGIFSSEPALSKARKVGNSPAFIKFSRGRIRYPRPAVISFLLARLNGENSPLNNKEIPING